MNSCHARRCVEIDDEVDIEIDDGASRLEVMESCDYSVINHTAAAYRRHGQRQFDALVGW